MTINLINNHTFIQFDSKEPEPN